MSGITFSTACFAMCLVGGTPPEFFDPGRSVPVAIEAQRANPEVMKGTAPLLTASAYERIRQIAVRDGFNETERALLADAANPTIDNRAENTAVLALFYSAHRMNAEALKVATGFEGWRSNAAMAMIAGRAMFDLGRWSDSVDVFALPVLSGNEMARGFRGMANTELGAYSKASIDFLDRSIKLPLHGYEVRFHLARALTATHVGNIGAAQQSLSSLRALNLDGKARSQRNLIEASIMLRDGRERVALNNLHELAERGLPPASLMARVEIIDFEVSRGLVRPEDAKQTVNDVLLQWRGGNVERRSLMVKANIAEIENDIETAMTARRDIISDFPGADIAIDADKALRENLSGLFEHRGISPLTAARIFYQNVDLAPPGHAGDALIRKVIDRLVALDLLSEAIELLDHQTFRRFRSEARSVAATELAELHLANGNAPEALSVLNRTKRTGLSEDINNRRRLVKARAYFETGNAENALDEVKADTSATASFLRAEVFKSNAMLAEASAAYVSGFDSLGDEVFTDKQTAVFITALSTVFLAGDIDTAREFADDHIVKLSSEQTRTLVNQFLSDNLAEDPDIVLAAFDAGFAPLSQ